MINLHINTHLAQTIGVEMGCPEVTRPKSFEEAMCCNDSSWLQKVHPPFHRGVCHKKFEVATIRVYASCFCFFWTMCVCVVCGCFVCSLMLLLGFQHVVVQFFLFTEHSLAYFCFQKKTLWRLTCQVEACWSDLFSHQEAGAWCMISFSG